MAAVDCLCALAAFLLARLLWLGSLPVSPERTALCVFVAALTAVVFRSFGLYEVHRLSTAEEFRRIMLAVSLVVTTTVSLTFWTQQLLSRFWLLLWWLLTFASVTVARRLWHGRVRRLRSGGALRFRTLLVGANEEAARLAERMAAVTSSFGVLGHVLPREAAGSHGDLPVLGFVDELPELVRRHRVDSVVVASSATRAADVAKVLKLRRLTGVDVWVTANFPRCLPTRMSIRPVGGFMALSLSQVRLSGAQAAAKRAFDLLLAGTGLVLSLPVWAAVAVAIKLTSAGPVLFRQQRVGRGGQRFTLLKFRTMVVDAERLLDGLRERNEADGPLFKLRDDPRVTRVGRWLRRTSLDELPQLLNILKGEMSVVGPRPPLPDEVAAYEDWQLDRLEAPPGLTGLWQISGRSQLTFDEYVRLDLYYIENWSLAYDLFIVAKTIPMVLASRGAY
jgi:exopolysaccharide biosynthesis polyprenyl glycosylphosphotransferase